MAVIAVPGSYSVAFYRGAEPEWSANLDSLSQGDLSPPIAPRDEVLPHLVECVDNTPVSLAPAAAIAATRARSFLDDFYHRIIVLPSPLDLGFVVNNQQIPVEVFNGYFEPRTLEGLLAANAAGIAITGPVPPSTWLALETKTYQVAVSTDGPATIDAQFLFDWEGTIDDAALKVRGVRLVSMPYIFQAPCKETLSWKTNVLTANDGSEQRIRLRKRARQSLTVAYPLPYAELARAENLVYGWLHRRWAVPLWEEAQFVGAIASGVNEILVDTTAVDFRTDGLAFVYDSARQNETLQVAAVAADRITLSFPTGSAYENAWVTPVRLGRLTSNPTRTTSGYAGLISMEYDFLDNLYLDPGPSAVQFLGRDVYFEEVLTSSGELTDTFQRRIDEVDYDLADAAAFYSPWANTRIARPHKFLLQGLADIWAFRRWLHRRAGRLRPFWQPSFENNLRLLQTGTLTNSVIVSSDDYKAFASARKHLAIQLSNDSWELRTITAVTLIDATETLVGLDSPLGVDAGAVVRICFLGLKRLDTDRVELQWNPNRTLEAQIRMLEIEP